jgi:hypothetical protein
MKLAAKGGCSFRVHVGSNIEEWQVNSKHSFYEVTELCGIGLYQKNREKEKRKEKREKRKEKREKRKERREKREEKREKRKRKKEERKRKKFLRQIIFFNFQLFSLYAICHIRSTDGV